jgi:hypothetical protein
LTILTKVNGGGGNELLKTLKTQKIPLPLKTPKTPKTPKTLLPLRQMLKLKMPSITTLNEDMDMVLDLLFSSMVTTITKSGGGGNDLLRLVLPLKLILPKITKEDMVLDLFLSLTKKVNLRGGVGGKYRL